MSSAGGRLQAYEKTCVESVARSYPSVVRFAGHVQLKGVRPRTVEAYGRMVRLLAGGRGGIRRNWRRNGCGSSWCI